MSNIVYITTSLDGYIADKDGGLDWLQSIPNPENLDMGWVDLMTVLTPSLWVVKRLKRFAVLIVTGYTLSQYSFLVIL